MKRFFSIVLCLSALVACKKESQSEIAIKKEYNVTFNINGLNSGSGDSKSATISSNSTSNDSEISKITYLAYNEYDALVDSVSQDNSGDTFGSILGKLAPGKYTLVFIASKNSFLLEGAGNLNYLNLVFPQDVFLSKTTVTISRKDVVKDISLTKVSGKLQIEIEDFMPQNAAEIQISISNAPDKLMIKTGRAASVSPINMIIPVEQNDLGKAGKIIETDILASSTPINTITITLLDADKNVLAEKVLNNVTITKSTNTVLSAKLFEYEPSETMLASN